jgi:hypothetical protein
MMTVNIGWNDHIPAVVDDLDGTARTLLCRHDAVDDAIPNVDVHVLPQPREINDRRVGQGKVGGMLRARLRFH